MNVRDYIDKLSLSVDEVKSFLDIMNDIMIELDQSAINNRYRKQILKFVGKFYVVWKGLTSLNKTFDKELNILWHKVFELEEKEGNYEQD